MKGKWRNILDESACLSRRQLRNYIEGRMVAEELHAIEHHLNTCHLCSEALSGYESSKSQPANPADPGEQQFLRDYFSTIHPEVHLNSFSPAATVQPVRKGRKRFVAPPIFRASNLAAAVILTLGVLWYLDRSDTASLGTAPASDQAQPLPEPQPAPAALPVVVEEETSIDTLTTKNEEVPVAKQAVKPVDTGPEKEQAVRQKKATRKLAVSETKSDATPVEEEITADKKKGIGATAASVFSFIPKLFSKKNKKQKDHSGSDVQNVDDDISSSDKP